MTTPHYWDVGRKRPRNQLSTMLLAAGIGTALIACGPSPENGSGMALLILLWILLTYALMTAIFYAKSRLFMKQWPRVVTLIGVTFLLYTCLSYFFDC